MIKLDYTSADQLMMKHGEPLYVYSKSNLISQAQQALSFGSPYGFSVRYAMKANPHPDILRLFDSMGLLIDASSEFEVEQAKQAGIKPQNIALNSQQLPHNLATTLDGGVLFTATSLHQLETYGQSMPNTSLAVRINPGDGSGASRRVTTGGASAGFGIWHEYIPNVLEIASKYNLTINKIHTHIGAGTDPEKWQQVAVTSLSLLEHFLSATTLSLGGGFKVARMPEEKSADMSKISPNIHKLVEQFAEDSGRKIAIEIEPGTFLTANCGVLLARVIDVVDTGTNGYNFIKLNTGMNDILRPTLYGAQHPIRLLSQLSSTNNKDYVVIGHNCESGDILTPTPGDPEGILTRSLPEARIGDIVAIDGAGAYCASMRVRGYNAFPDASEILID